MRVLIQRWPCGCGSSSGIRALGIRLRLFGNRGSQGSQNITIQALATGSARTSICQGRASVISIMFRGLSTLARLTPAALAAPAAALCDEKSARGALADLIDESEAKRGDGTSLGPTMVRLAWHSAGTFCARTGTGGSDGGRMKYCPESAWGANAGLADVRAVVEKVVHRVEINSRRWRAEIRLPRRSPRITVSPARTRTRWRASWPSRRWAARRSRGPRAAPTRPTARRARLTAASRTRTRARSAARWRTSARFSAKVKFLRT